MSPRLGDSLVGTALGLLAWAFGFFGRHILIIFGIGLLAALGRALQVSRKTAFSKAGYVAFEVVVEAVRALIIFAVVGAGDLRSGVQAIWRFLASTGDRSAALNALVHGVTLRWPTMLACFIAFSLAGAAANVAIFTGASALSSAAAARLGPSPDEDKARKLGIVLFIKNLTVIPFTVVWLWGLVMLLAR
jgi:hypothetical protein